MVNMNVHTTFYLVFITGNDKNEVLLSNDQQLEKSHTPYAGFKYKKISGTQRGRGYYHSACMYAFCS